MFDEQGGAVRPVDAAALSGLLVLLSELDTTVGDAELIERISVLEKVKGAVAAAQARMTAAFVASQRRAKQAAGVPAKRWDQGICAQVALARRESPARAARYTGWATVLVGELPCTFAALQAGNTTEWRAMIVARETIWLSRADRATVDGELAGRLPDLGDRHVDAETRKIAYRLDPEGFVARSRAAASDRRVSLRPAPDTMSRLTALLPAAQGVAAYHALLRAADAARAAGDPRSRGQVMADTLVERITGQATADRVPVSIDLVMTDHTLFGDHLFDDDRRPHPNSNTRPARDGGAPRANPTAADDDHADAPDDTNRNHRDDAGDAAGDDAGGDHPEGAAAPWSDDYRDNDSALEDQHDSDTTDERQHNGNDTADHRGSDGETAHKQRHRRDGEPSHLHRHEGGGTPGGSDRDVGTGNHSDDTASERARPGAPPNQVDPVARGEDGIADTEERPRRSDEPAYLVGCGPIPAGVARDLARVTGADAWVRRLYLNPKTGDLAAMDSRARVFPARIRDALIIRDQVCRTLWCGAPIRHADHARTFADGGETSLPNGQGLCEACNYAKQAPGWRTAPAAAGTGESITITTPTGHTYLSRPPGLPGSPTPEAATLTPSTQPHGAPPYLSTAGDRAA